MYAGKLHCKLRKWHTTMAGCSFLGAITRGPTTSTHLELLGKYLGIIPFCHQDLYPLLQPIIFGILQTVLTP